MTAPALNTGLGKPKSLLRRSSRFSSGDGIFSHGQCRADKPDPSVGADDPD